MGGELIAALVASAEERKIGIRPGSGSTISGATTLGAERRGRAVRAGAVVLASGGFEWNQRLQDASCRTR